MTAASKGLGLGAARALAAEGCNVALNARDAARLRTVADELPGPALALPEDVTDPSAPARLVDATVERFGGLDILVANAGGPAAGPGARPRRRGDRGSHGGEPAHLDPPGACGRAAHAGRRLGAHRADHVLRREAADPDAGRLEHRPDRTVGLGKDGRRRPRARRHHAERAVPGDARDRPRSRAGSYRPSREIPRTSAASPPSCARRTPATSRAPRSRSTVPLRLDSSSRKEGPRLVQTEQQFDALADKAWEGILAQEPLMGTFVGRRALRRSARRPVRDGRAADDDDGAQQPRGARRDRSRRAR